MRQSVDVTGEGHGNGEKRTAVRVTWMRRWRKPTTSMRKSSFLVYLFLPLAESFHLSGRASKRPLPSRVVAWLDRSEGSLADSATAVGSEELPHDPLLDESVAGKFTIRTCASTSCSARRRQLRLDEFATYTAFYVLSQERAPSVSVAESPCIGSCRLGPCVAIEHDDYDGPVSVEGMTPDEFAKRVFVHVEAADRVEHVWSCVQNAIRTIAKASPASGGDERCCSDREDMDLGSVEARTV
jgi:(2Fe-2S) ferredoxin